MYAFVFTVLLLSFAIIVGNRFERLRLPAVVGNIIGGMLVGPILVLILSLFLPYTSSVVSFLSVEYADKYMDVLIDFSVVILMFGAGLEVDLKALKHAGKRAVLVAVFGVLIPFIFGVLIGLNFGLSLLASLYIGAALSITAVALSVTTLMQLGVLQRDYGIAIVGAAVVDDIIGTFILTVLLGMEKYGEIPPLNELFFTILIALGFVLAGIYIGPLLAKQVFRRVLRFTSEERLGLSLIFIFIFAILADISGLHAMIGAFIAGMAVRDVLTKYEMETISKWSFGFFGPLFFAWVGFSVTFSGEVISIFLPIIVLAAFAGKIIGGFIGAKLSGMSVKSSLIVGIGMNARAAVELVVAQVALEGGIITRDVFSAIVLMAVISALTTPILLKYAVKKYG
ncbi:MAG: cation:proton antiporter [Thermoplasmata archaeon]|nr:cation:proton antiporter [Thermoplasmata archaeon]